MLLHADLLNCGDYFWELILWLLGAFILGYLLSWFLNAKYRDRIPILEADLASWKSKATDLETELSSAKYEREKTAEELASCKRARADVEMKLRACMEQVADSGSSSGSANFVAAAPVTTSGSSAQNLVSGGGNKGNDTSYAALIKSDNLQVVEGIGPKIESIFKENGISNWADLSAADPAKLSAILEAAGPRYRIHDPKTWPEQAKLANEGKWQELIKYQRFLGGGKENENINSGSSKVEKIYMAARGLKAFAADDLKVVEGIGPKIESLLKAAKIDSHIELAQTSVEKIKEVLDAAGDRYRLADPSTWPKQARMAAEGKWEELKDYQDFLQGGKE